VKGMGPGCRAIIVGVAIALLVGCGGGQPPIGVSGMPLPGLIGVETPEAWRDLYVLDGNGGPGYSGTVTVYHPGERKPFRTVSKGMGAPQSIAFDRAGNLYVGNVGGITVYRRGTNTLIRTIKFGKGVYGSVFALAFDRDGYLYANVFTTGGFIAIYYPNSSRRFATIRDQIHSPSDIKFDHAGDLFVANGSNKRGNGWISVYAPRSTRPLRIIRGGFSFSENPFKLAFDREDNLYSGNESDITVYAPRGDEPFRTIQHGVNFVQDMEFDADGNLYVANCTDACSSGNGTVTVYAPGKDAPMRTITAGIYNPFHLTLDALGRLYVANWTNYSVSVYRPGENLPVEVITDGVSLPYWVAFGP
jgi:hypothetical protein